VFILADFPPHFVGFYGGILEEKEMGYNEIATRKISEQ